MNAPVLAQPATTDLGLAQSIEPVVAIAVACELFQVDYRAVLSHRRDPSLDEARAFIVWMLRSFGEPHSYPAIGRALDRDHTTIINSHLMAVRLRLTRPILPLRHRGTAPCRTDGGNPWPLMEAMLEWAFARACAVRPCRPASARHAGQDQHRQAATGAGRGRLPAGHL
jgi:hypothetical protein